MPNPPFSPTQVHPAIERIRNQNQALNTPMECADCGGTYFVDLHAHQYSNSGYGTVQFRQLTVAPVPVKVCIGCGRTVAPSAAGGKMHPGSTPAFQEAVRLGEDFRAQQKVNANAVASKRELDTLQSQVAQLQGVIQQLLEGKEIPVDLPPAPPVATEPAPQLNPLATADPTPQEQVIVDDDKTESLGEMMQKRTGRGPAKPPKQPGRSR